MSQFDFLIGLIKFVTIKFSGAGLVFLVSVVAARTLSIADFGLFASALSLMALCSTISQWGLQSVLIKEMAISKTAGVRDIAAGEREGVVLSALMMSFTIGFLIVCLSQVFSLTLGLEVFATSTHFLLITITSLVYALTALSQGAIRGLGSDVIGIVPENVIRPLLQLAGMLIAFECLEGGLEFIELLLLLLMVGLMVFVLSSLLLLTRLHLTNFIVLWPTKEKTLAFVGAGYKLMTANFCSIATQHLPLIGLASLDSAQSAGLFKVSMSIALLVGLPLSALNLYVMPKFAALYASDNKQEILRLGYGSSATMACFVCPILFVLYYYAGPILTVVFGEIYADAEGVLRVLIFGAAINVLAGPVGGMLKVCNLEEFALVAAVSGLITTLFFGFIFWNIRGLEGMAIGYVAGLVVMNLVSTVALLKKRELAVSIFARPLIILMNHR